MLPFDPIVGTSLLVMAISTQDMCKVPKPTEINVIPQTTEVVFDYSKTQSQLQDTQINTINPYGFDATTHTNGYMSGDITMNSKVVLNHKAIGASGYACVWYDKIDLNIAVAPTIVIANEVAQDRCMLDAVKTHEMKHVMVDRRIVNKYSKIIGQKIFTGLKQRGFSAGPMKADQLQETATRMRATVKQLLDLEWRKMDIERQEAQQSVDSLGEYNSVNAQCPNYVSPSRKPRTQR